MKVVLISCVKSKCNTTTPIDAKDLYVSTLFKKAWAYAQTIGADRIYILSAKYYLISPSAKIEKYEKTLMKMNINERRKWADIVLKRMQEEGLDIKNDQFVILAGNAYSEFLVKEMTNIELPYKGKRIGEILKFLSKQLKK